MINYKHTPFKQYKQAGIPLEFYNRYKNKVSRILKASKSNYFSNKFEQCQSNIKSIWLTINSVLGNKRKKSDNITLLDSGGDEFSDSQSVADAFCDYFSTVATTRTGLQYSYDWDRSDVLHARPIYLCPFLPLQQPQMKYTSSL